VGDIGDVTEVVERLRLVRQARRKFLRMWAIDRSLVDPLVDRVAADLGEDPPPPPHDDAPPADKG
jgi:hypothetical protein